MIESNQDLFPESKRGEWIRLRTMIFIRWVAISGQLAAIVTACLLYTSDAADE